MNIIIADPFEQLCPRSLSTFVLPANMALWQWNSLSTVGAPWKDNFHIMCVCCCAADVVKSYLKATYSFAASQD